MSFEEKSVWATLIAMVLSFGHYFTVYFTKVRADNLIVAEMIPFFIGMVVWMIILMVILHTVLALTNLKQADEYDERDRLINLKAYRISGLFMGVCTLSTATISVFGILTPFAMGNLIFLTLVVAEIVHLTSQLFYYRMGV